MGSNLRTNGTALRSSKAAAGLCVFFALLAACSGDSTGVSSGPFAATISVSQVRGSYSQVNERWECTYTLTARGSGESGTFGFWESGDRDFRFENGGEESVFLDQGTMLEYWSLDRLYSGGVQRALRIAWGAEPFDLEYTFRLQPGDGSQGLIQSVSVGCSG